MSNPKLTVGIPTFNRPDLLRLSIESVLAQTFTDFRLIVSDNASEDQTADVVQSFGDNRIAYVRSERNVGAIGNFNRLIELTDTKYLLLLPDDDLLYPDHLRSAVELLERFDTLGLVHSAFHEIDGSSRIIRQMDPVASRAPQTIERSQRALERLMVSRWGLCFSSVVYRIEAIVKAGGFRQNDEPFCDRKLWMRIALGWDFAYIARPQVAFRAHEQAITSQLAARDGDLANHRERFLLYSRINFERRIEFLDEAELDARTAIRLRSLATLQRLIERAGADLGSMDVARGVAGVVRAYPRTLLMPGLWRLLVAQFGGRRVRSVIRAGLRSSGSAS